MSNAAVRAIPRSILYTPALKLEQVLAARQYEADVHLIDLEDSVPQPAKEHAREVCVAALAAAGNPRRTAIRINEMASIEAAYDIAAIGAARARPGFVFMTMVRSADEPRLLRSMLLGAGIDADIYLTIETVEALARIHEIAAACDGMILGSADLAATLGIDINWSGLLHARQTMALACAEFGAGCIDTGNFRLNAPDVLEEEAMSVKRLGFHGKGTVHPKELETINRVFRADESDLDHARRVIAASHASGDGVCILDGALVGPPFVRHARNMLARAEAWEARFGKEGGRHDSQTDRR
jgi:citrate lyase subunit beta/citryl-CoA lyase/(S)-citramalyl-CoA lyase